MNMHRMLWTGACLVLGAATVLAQDRPRQRAKGNDRPGVFNAKPAKGERYRDTLAVGDPAPDFTLPDFTGKKQVTLSDSRGMKPVVLVFGSCTCPPFRRQIGEVERIYQVYNDKADFLLVYIREAHPGSQIPGINEGQPIDQTETLAERMKLAADFAKELELTMPVVVDKEDNKVNASYAAWPNRLAIVGIDGKIAYMEKSGAGFTWGEVERWLQKFAAGSGSAVADRSATADKKIRGKVIRVDSQQSTLTLTVNGQDETFHVDTATQFFMSRKQNQSREFPGGFAALCEGREVTLTTETRDGKEVVATVTIAGRIRTRDKQ
jgi:thiol-disulfide isomerase/thioredoxin